MKNLKVFTDSPFVSLDVVVRIKYIRGMYLDELVDLIRQYTTREYSILHSSDQSCITDIAFQTLDGRACSVNNINNICKEVNLVINELYYKQGKKIFV